MFKILFAGLLFLIFTQNIYAFTKVNVKYKEVSETAYEEGEQIFTRPYFLEKGNAQHGGILGDPRYVRTVLSSDLRG